MAVVYTTQRCLAICRTRRGLCTRTVVGPYGVNI